MVVYMDPLGISTPDREVNVHSNRPPLRLGTSRFGVVAIWELPKIGVPYLGVPIIRILLVRVLY